MASSVPVASSAPVVAVLSGVPGPLRDELLRAFNDVLRNYRERRWEPSELNGGKLCEVVLIRVFHSVPVEEAQTLVDSLVERTLPVIWKVGNILRVLKPSMSARDKMLVLLYHAHDWLPEDQLREWAEYSNPSMFRDILVKCHKEKLLEYDTKARQATLSPAGIRDVETRVSLDM